MELFGEKSEFNSAQQFCVSLDEPSPRLLSLFLGAGSILFYFCRPKNDHMKAIADRKKAQNIGEYLIYMYQMEDLIRSYQGNLDEIYTYVISHYPVAEEEKQEIKVWFGDLAAQMQKEGLLEKGHLKSLQEIVNSLLDLHYQLLKSDSGYVETFHQVKPHLLEAIDAAAGEEVGNEIQICLNGVYGLLLCRLLGKKVSDRQLEAADAFGAVLSYLNFSYQQRLYLSSN